ncbi:MAG: GNAT family N-acetyltransferase [Chloroflexota bacterium]
MSRYSTNATEDINPALLDNDEGERDRIFMIRRYQEQDIEAVIEAWHQASLIAHPFLSEQFFAEENHNLRTRFLPHSQTWVYEAEGQVVGFISMVENEVGGLFVHPAWQRQGIGRALMDQASNVHTTLELDVFEANQQGRAFYAKYGFVPLKTHRDEETGEMMVRLRLSRQEARREP